MILSSKGLDWKFRRSMDRRTSGSSFAEIIHNNTKYTDMMKFQFLEQAMKIPASESNVLASFALTSANYKAAWEAVCARYNDKDKLVDMHIINMIDVKPMKEESARNCVA